MRRSRLWTDLLAALRDEQRGSASIEFLTVGMLLLVPTVYLVLALSSIQSASFAVEGAARQASRVFVQAETVGEAQAAASRAIAVTLADYGLDAAAARVVTISTVAPLPLFPAVLDADIPPGVPIDSVATEQVSRFAGSR